MTTDRDNPPDGFMDKTTLDRDDPRRLGFILGLGEKDFESFIYTIHQGYDYFITHAHAKPEGKPVVAYTFIGADGTESFPMGFEWATIRKFRLYMLKRCGPECSEYKNLDYTLRDIAKVEGLPLDEEIH